MTSGLPPLLDFLLVFRRDNVLRLKPFAREEAVTCSKIEVALRQRLSWSNGFIRSASESHAAVTEIMAREQHGSLAFTRSFCIDRGTSSRKGCDETLGPME